jgi:alpha,alpha-trehalase
MSDLQHQWSELDAAIGTWWEDDLHRAGEAEIRSDPTGGLMFLPHPFVTPGGAEGTFPTMYCWDTYFIDRALLAHGRLDLVRNHILNYAFMIERQGFMPNTNHAFALHRSQVPVYPDGVWRHYLAGGDLELLARAFPLLRQEYENYWCAEHHRTPTGLATNRDLGDPALRPELAAEAEALDWTPIYGGDVRRCVPSITNCALVRYADVLALAAHELGRPDEADRFAEQARDRAQLIRDHCWSEELGFFVEYDYVAGAQLPYLSLCAYWTLWAKVATPEQARRLVERLPDFEHDHGLTSTAEAYPDPHESLETEEIDLTMFGVIAGGGEPLQWMYPAGWAPEQLIVIEGLDAFGYVEAGDRVARRFLSLMLERYEETGKLWEKYNVVDGSLILPNSRCGNIPMRGWSAAAAVLMGHRLFSSSPTVAATSVRAS